MALTRKLLWEAKAAPPATRDVVPLLQSIDRRLGYLVATLWVSIAAAAAFWVIHQAVVIGGW
jgi:hypothetical protein